MRILYSPNDISKITLKTEWNLENKNQPSESSQLTSWYFKVNLKNLMIPKK